MRNILVVVASALCLFVTDNAECAPPKAAQEATIHITADIDEDLAKSVDEELEAAVKARAKHLTVVINTSGGEFDAGMNIIQSITDSKIPTTCIVNTKAASMGAVILESSACGERVIHSHSFVMIHGAANSLKGNHREVSNDVVRLKAINTSLAQIICARTGWPIEKYWQRVIEESREIWLVGDEALEHNLVDRVIPVPEPSK